MKTTVIIPARYELSRFPGKPLALICGKPMIQWVYQEVQKCNIVDDVYVATDDQRISGVVEEFGGQAIMTSSELMLYHKSIWDVIVEKSGKYLPILRADAPNMTGMARKNENSAAAGREIRRVRAPTMVAPEREVPGISART